MPITVVAVEDGFSVERRTDAGVCAIHVPEAEVGQLLEDLLNAAVGSQIAGAPFDPQVELAFDTVDSGSYRLEDEL